MPRAYWRGQFKPSRWGQMGLTNSELPYGGDGRAQMAGGEGVGEVVLSGRFLCHGRRQVGADPAQAAGLVEACWWRRR